MTIWTKITTFLTGLFLAISSVFVPVNKPSDVASSTPKNIANPIPREVPKKYYQLKTPTSTPVVDPPIVTQAEQPTIYSLPPKETIEEPLPIVHLYCNNQSKGKTFVEWTNEGNGYLRQVICDDYREPPTQAEINFYEQQRIDQKRAQLEKERLELEKARILAQLEYNLRQIDIDSMRISQQNISNFNREIDAISDRQYRQMQDRWEGMNQIEDRLDSETQDWYAQYDLNGNLQGFDTGSGDINIHY